MFSLYFLISKKIVDYLLDFNLLLSLLISPLRPVFCLHSNRGKICDRIFTEMAEKAFKATTKRKKARI